MNVLVVAVVLLALIALTLLGAGVRMVQQYERGIVLRFGRLLPRVRTPGLQAIIPFADRMTKVSMQTVVMGIPAQGAITRDNVTLTLVMPFPVELLRFFDRAAPQDLEPPEESVLADPSVTRRMHARRPGNGP
jgi:regulator of protease activity HflC (stomatin/prohibitin superfamily)